MSFTSSCHCHPKLLLSPPTHIPSMKMNRDLLSPSTGRRPSFPLGRQATVASRPPTWRELPLGTSAIADQYGSTLAAAAPAKTGDISVFLQTGAVLLLAYWIANFVVPDLISKYLGFDKINEDENSEDDDRKISSEGGGGGEERDRGTQANSTMTKKRGFDSTRS
ncbi:uncharacterized protein LOC115757227 [Rhodamnia argentea]|uniref:Uncharacterized protein LOC115757227 n=1 Tax=Rhodamnia argentea TaxID=178133 RepID=A0A8B8R463_9MYRT|nr:uncharacterized protein LOC115757227 [Rhodamnia argentea]